MKAFVQALADAYAAAIEVRREGAFSYTREARARTERATERVLELVPEALEEIEGGRVSRTVAIEGRFFSRLSTRRRAR